MVGAYAAVSFASSSASKALWSTNPLKITFSGIGGISSSGSAGDSFKCAPDVSGPITLKAIVSDPIKISLTTSPSTFESCGASFSNVTVTAHCLVVAPNCKGSYTGTITIFKGYATYPPNLSVTIVVS
jgi:hypothetical protein